MIHIDSDIDYYFCELWEVCQRYPKSVKSPKIRYEIFEFLIFPIRKMVRGVLSNLTPTIINQLHNSQ